MQHLITTDWSYNKINHYEVNGLLGSTARYGGRYQSNRLEVTKDGKPKYFSMPDYLDDCAGADFRVKFVEEILMQEGLISESDSLIYTSIESKELGGLNEDELTNRSKALPLPCEITKATLITEAKGLNGVSYYGGYRVTASKEISDSPSLITGSWIRCSSSGSFFFRASEVRQVEQNQKDGVFKFTGFVSRNSFHGKGINIITLTIPDGEFLPSGGLTDRKIKCSINHVDKIKQNKRNKVAVSGQWYDHPSYGLQLSVDDFKYL